MEDLKIRNINKVGRSNVLSQNAIVTSSHPLASQIGIEILKMEGLQLMQH